MTVPKILPLLKSLFTSEKLWAAVLSIVVLIGVTNYFNHGTIAVIRSEQNTKAGSRFESSNTRSRYVLTEAIAEQGSVTFNLDQARFAAPDVVHLNDTFFSIFTPGISFVAVPFYMLGKVGGIPHVTTFLSTAFFAVLNVIIITHLSYQLTGKKFASMLAGILFLIGSNALVYALTLTQHHGSTTVILLSLLIAFAKPKLWRSVAFGALCGIGFLFDFPNLFLLFPIGLYIVFQHFQIRTIKDRWQIQINFKFLAIGLGMLPLLAIFGWYNLHTTGRATAFAQFFPQSEYFDSPEKQAQIRANRANVDPYGDKLPFSTRSQLRSFYILLTSNERSWFYYSPLMIIGILAFIRNKKLLEDKRIILLISLILLNIVMYGMFSDPWGGWSFGPRYLIPATAIMSIFVSIAIAKHGAKPWFVGLFWLATLYSVGVSTAGALTTALIPPKVEAEQLEEFIPYTYEYNFNLLKKNQTNSLIYHNLLASTLTAQRYWLLVNMVAVTPLLGLYALQLSSEKKEKRRA